MAIKKVQREEIKQSPREKLVIYKSLGDFKITPESNFKARIQNANKITDLKDFDTVDEIIDYYKKWFHSTEDDFIIDDSVKEVIPSLMNNPMTGDNVMASIAALLFALIVIITCLLIIVKIKKK